MPGSSIQHTTSNRHSVTLFYPSYKEKVQFSNIQIHTLNAQYTAHSSLLGSFFFKFQILFWYFFRSVSLALPMIAFVSRSLNRYVGVHMYAYIMH